MCAARKHLNVDRLDAPSAQVYTCASDWTQQQLRDIEATGDLLERALKLAGLVSRVFREAGWDLVVVGGSAVEFYTEQLESLKREAARELGPAA